MWPICLWNNKIRKNKGKNHDVEIRFECEGYYIDDDGIACPPMLINKVRLLAIRVL
jgi:hypothetical protein